ncbi:MAG: T9SS type A sorting domain-containing protein [Bacteroidales bacterium]|nr:T9SS type A sorting domain-containing protein [Bacteroidales bacterium]MBN2820531.1 T9SS type A sorting domain-containing protein [Bacteroidales bacterium]
MNKFLSIIVIGLLVVTSHNLQAQGWVQVGNDIDGEAAEDQSGFAISMSSDASTIAIGAPYNDGNGTDAGHVTIYSNVDGTWTQLGADIDGEATRDYSGKSVSLSSDGSIVAIGAFFNDGNGSEAGHVRVFKNNGGTWYQLGNDIDGETSVDLSGCSVSLSGDGSTVAVGAYANDGNGSEAGHVRIYRYYNGKWSQIGNDIDGEAADDRSGHSISLSSDGSVVAIGAPYNDGNGIDAGHVRIFMNNGGTWSQIGNDIDGEAAGDQFGNSVSLSSNGSVIIIGAPYNDGNGANAGHVRIYKNNGGTWTQIGSDIDGEASDDYSGWSVSISSDGSIIATGARQNDGNGPGSGHVRVFKNISDTWSQVGLDINGEAIGDESGRAVSLSSDGITVAIGANKNNGSGNDAGQVRVFAYDTDGDGTADSEDDLPFDNTEDTDTDGDGLGNNADTDDDNDGIPDLEDNSPLGTDTDTDGDNIPDTTDTDDDNDGVEDSADDFPLDNTEDTDTDGDNTGNNTDTDDDNDGTVDSEDDFPLDNTEYIDTDGDGIGNNSDTDDDNDGAEDALDAFPLDSSEYTDTDNDGTGNNVDTDDDNDGIADADDDFPLDSTENTDTDNDGIGNNADNDDDNDGTIDTEDDFPLDASEDTDSDGDGIGDNTDPDNQTGINVISDSDFKIFPNPANHQITIDAGTEYTFTNITVFNINGHLVISQKFVPLTQTTIDISDIEEGIYMIQVTSNEGIYSSIFSKE